MASEATEPQDLITVTSTGSQARLEENKIHFQTILQWLQLTVG